MLVEPIGYRERADVIQYLLVRRIIRIIVRHREIEIMRLRLRRDEMCAVIDRRAWIFLIPDSAHVGMALIHVERHVVAHAGARQREPRRPRTHDANARISSHIARSAWPCRANA